ncbi:hypothetical protein TUMEXPCC7403_08425 [Tumidithrix helvetica PCC 7403]|uniref:hypothetical protein n=1 Tax=Tumidithrix helvetica TaxID=3457545 RepID=UPI003C84D8DA
MGDRIRTIGLISSVMLGMGGFSFFDATSQAVAQSSPQNSFVSSFVTSLNTSNSQAGQAIAILSDRIRRDGFYQGRFRPECLIFQVEGVEANFVSVAVREKHGGSCPGDPNTSPQIDRFRVVNASDILWLDLPRGEFIPYEQARSTSISSTKQREFRSGFAIAQRNAENNRACMTALQTVQSQLELGRNAIAEVYKNDISNQFDGYPQLRPFSYNFRLRGSGVDTVMSSNQLLASVSQKIIEACPQVSLVRFSIAETDWVRTYGDLGRPKVEEFECIDPPISTQKIRWGQQVCL